MKQLQGIADASIVITESTGKQRVIVTDGDGIVVLSMSSSNPVGLTPEQARFIAASLGKSADRIEAEIKNRGAEK